MTAIPFIVLGVPVVIVLALAAKDAAACKDPWREFAILAIPAAIGAVMVGGLGWLALLAISWLAAGGWVWIFLLILTVPVWFWLGAALLCLLMHIAGAFVHRS